MNSFWNARYVENAIDNRWAATLVNTLIQADATLSEEISFWQRSINGQHDHMEWADLEFARRIQCWYEKEVEIRGYKSEKFRVSPEYSMLLKEFRNDRNYALKNLVELIVRTLIFEILKEEGFTANAYVTSDADDVMAGVDVIVEITHDQKWKRLERPEYIGYDIAVSENNEYLDNKTVRTETTCKEWNYLKRLGNIQMPRVVFSISPSRMTTFLSEIMDQISANGTIDRARILESLPGSRRNVEQIKEDVRNKTKNLLLH